MVYDWGAIPSCIPRNLFDALYVVSHQRVDAVDAGAMMIPFRSLNMNRFEALPAGSMDGLTSLRQLWVVAETLPVDRAIPGPPSSQTTFFLHYTHATEILSKPCEQQSLPMMCIVLVPELKNNANMTR